MIVIGIFLIQYCMTHESPLVTDYIDGLNHILMKEWYTNLYECDIFEEKPYFFGTNFCVTLCKASFISRLSNNVYMSNDEQCGIEMLTIFNSINCPERTQPHHRGYLIQLKLMCTL